MNVKWKSEAEEFRPYVGGGVGLLSSYVELSGPGVSENEWFKDAGFQFMGGIEFNRQYAVEFMGQRVFESNIDWLWSVLFGIRF